MNNTDFMGALCALAGHSVHAGDVLELKADVIVVSDLVSKGCLDSVGELVKPEMVEIVIEHALPSVIPSGDHHRDMVRFAAARKTVFNHGKGLEYFDLAKRKAAGENIRVAALCGSRVPMLGIAGILGVQVTPEQMTRVLESGVVTCTVPQSVQVKIIGHLGAHCSVRDAAMALVKDFGSGMEGKNVELCGGIGEFSLDEKLQFANYLTAAGAVNAWLSEETEPAYTLDLTRVEPMIACPGSMTDLRPVRELEGAEPFRLAFIGGCGGGSLAELRRAADCMRGKKVAYGMRLVVGPADRETYLKAADEGLIAAFIEAGAVFLNPGCLGCTGVSCGALGKNEVSLSTGSFNTPGCCGAPTSRVYLASAETVARGAVSGVISAGMLGE